MFTKKKFDWKQPKFYQKNLRRKVADVQEQTSKKIYLPHATQIFLVKFWLFPVKFCFGKNYLADDEKN